MTRDSSLKRRRWILPAAIGTSLVLLGVSCVWCRWVAAQIQNYSQLDQAAPADAIGVFGAAEYDGKPSPVYRARLDHAYDLYRRGIAPLIIPIGGPGGDRFTEGSVGAAYLVSKGVPETAIIAGTDSRNTAESARRIAVIAHANGLRRLVIVSDGTHMFRIHAMCAAEGLDVLTSPRARPAVEDKSHEASRYVHEIISYTLWRLHLH